MCEINIFILFKLVKKGLASVSHCIRTMIIFGIIAFCWDSELLFGYPLKSESSQLHRQAQIYPFSFGYTQLFESSPLDTNNVSTGITISIVKEKSEFWHGRRISDEIFYKKTSYKSAFWGKRVIEGDQFGVRSFPYGLSILPGNENPLLLAPLPTLSLSLGGELILEKISYLQMPEVNGSLPYANPYTTSELEKRLDEQKALDVSIGPSLKLSAEHKVYALSINYSLNLSFRYSVRKSVAYKSLDFMFGLGFFWVN